MDKKLTLGGCVGAFVALGFVFPQIAQMRMDGALGPGGVVLLLFGVVGTLIGVSCAVQGLMRRPSPPRS